MSLMSSFKSAMLLKPLTFILSILANTFYLCEFVSRLGYVDDHTPDFQRLFSLHSI